MEMNEAIYLGCNVLLAMLILRAEIKANKALKEINWLNARLNVVSKKADDPRR